MCFYFAGQKLTSDPPHSLSLFLSFLPSSLPPSFPPPSPPRQSLIAQAGLENFLCS